MAVVDLDNPPSWWSRIKHDNLSAAEARRLAGTAGASAVYCLLLVLLQLVLLLGLDAGCMLAFPSVPELVLDAPLCILATSKRARPSLTHTNPTNQRRPGAAADASTCGGLHPEPHLGLLLLCRGRAGAGALHS